MSLRYWWPVLLASLVGCQNGSFLRPSSDAPPDSAAQVKRKLQPCTLVNIADQHCRLADEAQRTTLEKQQYREEARRAYQQAIEQDPKFLPAYAGLANLYAVMDDHSHAIATYHQALKQGPKQAELWYQLGMCHARLKEWPQAIEALGEAAKLDPESRPVNHAYGYALARAGQTEESFKVFAHIEGEAAAHYNVARMLDHVGDLEASKHHLRLALAANPNLSAAADLLAQLESPVPPGRGAIAPVGYRTTGQD